MRGGLRQTSAAAAEARHPLEKAGGSEAFREGLRILREIETQGCAGGCCCRHAQLRAAAAGVWRTKLLLLRLPAAAPGLLDSALTAWQRLGVAATACRLWGL